MATNTLAKLTELFEKQIGVKEKGNNNVIYNTHYYGHEVSGDAYPWCCAFIWDVFRMAGLSHLFVGGQMTAYCPFVVNYARNNNQWVTKGYKPGDLLLYDWNGDGVADHIGFCTSWSGSKGQAIEGNTSGKGGDGVYLTDRTSKQVMGAYRPDYTGSHSTTPATPPSTPISTPAPTGEQFTYVVQYGDCLWNIALKYLGAGIKYQEIMDLNGMKSSAIDVGQVLLIPGKDDRKTFSVTVSAKTYKALKAKSEAANLTIGQIIDTLI